MSFNFGPIEIKVQTICYEMLRKVYPDKKGNAEEGDDHAIEWIKLSRELAEKLFIRVNE